MEETIAQLIGGLRYDGTHLGVLAQFTILEEGPAKGASFNIDIRKNEITEDLVRRRKSQKMIDFGMIA